MCGLVGFVNNETAPVTGLARTMSELLYMDMWRGEDATGVAAVLKKSPDRHIMHKRALRAPDFLNTPEWLRISKNIDDIRYFIGHNRKATQGDSWVDWNAHPFHQNNILLSHNGSLLNEYQLMQKWRQYFGTDSELLAHLLNEQEPETLFPKVQGAFALTWYDFRDSSMNFIRNPDRPLHFAVVKDKNLMFWASERDMLEYAVQRNGFEIESLDMLVEGWHLKIKEDVRDWEETNVELYKAPVTQRRTVYPNRYTPNTNNVTPINQRTNNAVKEQNKLMANLNLSRGQWITFNYMSYEKHRHHNATTGKMIGIPMENKHISGCFVEVNSFNPSLFSMSTKFKGRVCGINTTFDDKYPTIMLDFVEELVECPDAGALTSYEADIKGKHVQVVDKPEGKLPIIYHGNNTADTCTNCTDTPCVDTGECASPDDDDDVETKVAGYSVFPGEKSNRRKYRGPNGRYFRRKDFNKLINSGCDYCTGPIVSSDHVGLLWTNQDRPICGNCADQYANGEIELGSYIKQ